MECTLCNIRSAIGTCNECHTMVCEECGVQCEHCGKWACPQHVYMTSSGKTLCLPCQEERRARHAAARRRAEGHETPIPGADIEGMLTPEEQELEEEQAVLTASVRQPPPPWKLSLYTAVVALILVGAVFIFPGLRRIPLAGGSYLPTPYVLLIVPIIAIFWGVLGFIREEMQSDRNRSIAGVGLAIVAAVLMFVAVQTDPARVAEQRAMQDMQQRENMTPAERAAWRKEKLGQYQR